LLLDNNAFDYIYDNNLTDKVLKAVDEGKVQLFATDVQKQESENFPNNKQTRKQQLIETSEKIRVEFIATYGGVVAPNQDDVEGFGGSKPDRVRVMGDREKQLSEAITHYCIQDQLKNSADVLALITAIMKNMDYLVTNDEGFEKSLKILKMDIDTKLQIMSFEDFRGLLCMLIT
jgi:hypothetical protein